MPRPLTAPHDPWDTRFGFFWYNDQEIFHSAQEDLDRQAETLAKAGINHVITFSCTHFRWSFRRHWGQLTEVLARVVEACHRSDIRVTEHHSSHLTFNPLNEEGVRYAERILQVRGSALDSWPHLLDDAEADPLIDGNRLSTFRQIDGRSGSWARSNYQGWCMCFNNPEYRRAYFQYLETLYAVGVDGIMTDDVQWFAAGHACACEHCRRLFAAQTGHELPEPGSAWEGWNGEYDQPSFVAWLDFRLRSNEDFHAAVTAHYESLGRRPLRPNYVSSALNRNPTAYSLETLPHLDWVFQECCFSTIIRYSWPHWAVEAAHRFAVARRRGIPSMSMFYPDRADTMLFTWGLAMSWGGLYLATAEGASLNQEEERLRDFERRHARLLRGASRLARLGFYDSRRNRELYGQAESRSLLAMTTWMQACYRGNLPFDLFQREELDRLAGYDAIVLNEVALLGDTELEAMRAYVEAGGNLVWAGRTGTLDERGVARDPTWPARMWDLDEMAGTGDGDQVRIVSRGRGQLILVPGDLGLGPYELPHNADRWQAEEVRVSYRAPAPEEYGVWDEIRGLLASLLPGGSDLVAQDLPEGVMVTPFCSADGGSLVVHLVNAAGTLDAAGEGVGHGDEIPFPEHRGMPPARLIVRKPGHLTGGTPSGSRYLDPAREDEVRVPVVADDDAVTIQINLALIRGYGLIEVPLR